MHHALRAARVPPFHAMAMARLAAEREAAGQRVLHLEVGQPATPAPLAARRAVAAALETEALGYSNAPGMMSLRRALAAHYRDWYDVEVDPEAVLVVAGASAGFTLAFLACFDAGARVGVVEPGYPCYRNTLLALGIEPVAIPVGPDTRWAPTPEVVDAAGPLDGLIVASPSNPTGTMLDATSLAALAAHCREREIRLISDEIYHGITYFDPAPTALACDPEAVIISSFSKYFSMTGWRLGWMVVPPELAGTVEVLQQNLFICAPTVSQVAGLAALGAHDELRGHVARYAEHRRLLLDGLAVAGLADTAEADGAFYVYADVSHLTDDSMGLCHRWLDELGVSCTPGVDFDLARGHHFVRFSYAGAAADITLACERLAEWRS
jgi:aspartate/methionine/tyrosine aminotransferase